MRSHSTAGEFHDDATLPTSTLWCKQTFQQCFSDSDCVLFPLQQQLFDFIDSRTLADAQGSAQQWLPFSIEFPSEMEVSQRLSVHTRSDLSSPLFSTSESSDARELVGKKRHQRSHFALLYGSGALSVQTRMFLATTWRGLQRIHMFIEPLQRHLYEIIRAQTPCHLYFDVERSVDFVGTCEEIVVCDSSAEDDEDDDQGHDDVQVEPCRMVVADLSGGGGERHSFRMAQSKYARLLGAACEIPAQHCRLDCPHRADNEDVDVTLLRELSAFIALRYACVTPSATHGGLDSLFDEVIIMRSDPLHSLGAPGVASAPRKFSQHYVIKLKDHCFEDAAAAGEFVLQFVDHLQARADTCPEVHRKLFFHGAPVSLSVLRQLDPEYGSSALPFLPRKCLIDTAVYSRNRMMRCLGSCKLHRDTVLQMEKHWSRGVSLPIDSATGGDPGRHNLSDLLHSLISLPVHAFEDRKRVPVTVVERKPKAATWTDSTLTLAVSEPQTPVRASLLTELASIYEAICGTACTLGAPKQCGDHYLILPILGTRFCQHVHREHRSNNVYFVVDTQAKTAVQKCFDPDCAHFRSAAVPLRSLQDAMPHPKRAAE